MDDWTPEASTDNAIRDWIHQNGFEQPFEVHYSGKESTHEVYAWRMRGNGVRCTLRICRAALERCDVRELLAVLTNKDVGTMMRKNPTGYLIVGMNRGAAVLLEKRRTCDCGLDVEE